MKRKKNFSCLLGILAMLFCMQTAAAAADNSSFFLEQITFHKGEAEDPGYFQLNADSEEGSIRFLNQEYRQMRVTCYTHFASFSSMLGNNPIRGFSPFGAAMDYSPLRFDVKRHLLLAREGTEGFGVYPDPGAGYAFFSLHGVEEQMFSSLPTYGVCLQYSTDRDGARFQMLPLLPNAFQVKVHDLDSRPIYEQTYTANIPADAVWLRISLSCAKRLQGPDGQLFLNSDEQPARISGIWCDERAVLPQEPSLPSAPSDSTSSDGFSKPNNSNDSSSEDSEGTSNPGQVPSDAPGSSSTYVPEEKLIPISPSGSASQGEEMEEDPPARSSHRKPVKESVHYSVAAPSPEAGDVKSITSSTGSAPASTSGAAYGNIPSQPADDLAAAALQEAFPGKADIAEDEDKDASKGKETSFTMNTADNATPTALRPVTAEDMPSPEPADPEHSGISPAVLLLYLTLVGSAAAFYLGMWIGIRKGRRGGEDSQKAKAVEQRGFMEGKNLPEKAVTVNSDKS